MKRRPVCLVCLFLMLCLYVTDLVGISMINGNPLPVSVQKYISEHPKLTVSGEVQNCQAAEYSLSVYLKQVCLTVGSEQIPIENIKVYLNKEEQIRIGMFLRVCGKLEEIPGSRNPGEFDSKQYYACQKIYYQMKDGKVCDKSTGYSYFGQFLQEIRQKAGTILDEAAGSYAGIFQAMILGERENLDAETKMQYQMAGIMHILAISGVKTLKLDIPLVPETRIKWAFMPLHIAKIYILKLCLDEEIIPRCRFPCSRGYLTKCINQQKKQ